MSDNYNYCRACGGLMQWEKWKGTYVCSCTTCKVFGKSSENYYTAFSSFFDEVEKQKEKNHKRYIDIRKPLPRFSGGNLEEQT